MKLVTFYKGSEAHLGCVLDGSVIDLTAACVAIRSALPDRHQLVKTLGTFGVENPCLNMRALLAVFDSNELQLLEFVSGLVAEVSSGQIPGVSRLPETNLKLCAPLPNPSSLRDGYAFREHVETMRTSRGLEIPPEFEQFPVFYFSNHQAVVGPGEVLVEERHLEELDYELELALVIGRGGKNISAARADEHIFGFTIMNDFSARKLQREEMKLSLGPAKGKDFATALGPYLVTRDELAKNASSTERGQLYNLEMTARVNGRELSRGNARSMRWTFAQIIERASYGVMLHPGDVIGSGTVGTGCLGELNASGVTKNLWLKSGDEVELAIEHLGTLKNKIVLRT